MIIQRGAKTMKANNEYTQAMEQAKANMADIAERGASACGSDETDSAQADI